MKKTLTLPEKCRRFLALKRAIKRSYEKQDALLDSIVLEMEPGQQIAISQREKIELADKFEEVNAAWKSTKISRYELKVLKV